MFYVFYCFNVFLKCFGCIFNIMCLFLLKINIQNYKYDAFFMGKLRLVLFSICTIIMVT